MESDRKSWISQGCRVITLGLDEAQQLVYAHPSQPKTLHLFLIFLYHTLMWKMEMENMGCGVDTSCQFIWHGKDLSRNLSFNPVHVQIRHTHLLCSYSIYFNQTRGGKSERNAWQCDSPKANTHLVVHLFKHLRKVPVHCCHHCEFSCRVTLVYKIVVILSSPFLNTKLDCCFIHYVMPSFHVLSSFS